MDTNIRQEYQVYVYYGALGAFEYYSDSYGFKERPYVKGVASRVERERYKEELSRFKKGKRVWFIFSHVYSHNGDSEEAYMVNYLESIGNRIDSFHDVRASAYLFDFTNNRAP